MFQQEVRKHLFQNFVTEHKRVPTKSELDEAVYTAQITDVDKLGISAYKVVTPWFGSEFSAEQENINRWALVADSIILNKKLDGLLDELDNAYKTFQTTVYRADRRLNAMLQRANGMVLDRQLSDPFSVVVEESFDTHAATDFDNTTAEIESGRLLLRRAGIKRIPLNETTIYARAFSNKQLIGQSPGSVEALKEADGRVFKYIVYCNENSANVTLIIDITFPQQRVNEIRLSGLALYGGTITCLVGNASNSLQVVEPAELPFSGTQIHIPLGKDCNTIQLRFNKSQADEQTTDGQFVYSWIIDELELLTSGYEETKGIWIGEYQVVNEFDEDIFFTKARLEPCVIVPEGTSIDWFLSIDGVNWLPAIGTVSFYNSDRTGSWDIYDSGLDNGAFALVPGAVIAVDERVLNTYITSSYADMVPKNQIRLIRNSLTTEGVSGLSGWRLKDGRYICSFKVEDPTGITIDFGPTGATLDGSSVVGITFITNGWHDFSTSITNWMDIDAGITKEEDFILKDPLYPYNHKLLIEGYSYTRTYIGRKVYNGVDIVAASVCKYLPPQAFEQLTSQDSKYLNTFTCLELNDDIYFVVKSDLSVADSENEIFDYEWIFQSNLQNELKVKAILSTSDATLTPVVDSFRVRCI